MTTRFSTKTIVAAVAATLLLGVVAAQAGTDPPCPAAVRQAINALDGVVEIERGWLIPSKVKALLDEHCLFIVPPDRGEAALAAVRRVAPEAGWPAAPVPEKLAEGRLSTAWVWDREDGLRLIAALAPVDEDGTLLIVHVKEAEPEEAEAELSEPAPAPRDSPER